MIVSVFNFKGGEGKTGIAVNLALTEGLALITNDVYSPIESAISAERLIKLQKGQDFPELPADIDVVYDLGGYVDSRTGAVLQRSDWVLIPVQNEYKALQTAINAIAEAMTFNPNIVVIANKLESDADFENIKGVIHGVAASGNGRTRIPVFPMKKTRAFDHVIEKGKSLREFVYEGGSLGYHFQTPCEQFDAIIEHLKHAKR